MTNVIVVGAQWGDEGKGKIVDWLSEKADVVVRFQGGHNAGHTLVIGEKVFKLSLLPSGVVRPNKLSVIGSGVVIDPIALFTEIDNIKNLGVDISPDNLIIAENAPIILSLHRQSDNMAEHSRGDKKIGTTGRGIGPAYEDNVARRAIRVCDLADAANLTSRVEALVDYHNAIRRGFDIEPISTTQIMKELLSVKDRLLSFAKPAWKILHQLKLQGKKILFEGAQGTMLDIDYGTYPYVTSSSTLAGQAFIGSGLGVSDAYVLGIAKSYTTRVGSGPFPTELFDNIGELIGERGKEFGTVTGRKRRCGWFDAVMVRQAIQISGIKGIALTKLDVLDGIGDLKICIGYEYNGTMYDYLPASIEIQANIKPIYEHLDGWNDSTRSARSFKDLPANAIKYVRRLEELIHAPVAVLSTSPERDDTILMHDPFCLNR